MKAVDMDMGDHMTSMVMPPAKKKRRLRMKKPMHEGMEQPETRKPLRLRKK